MKKLKVLLFSLLAIGMLTALSAESATLDRSKPDVYGFHPASEWKLTGGVTSVTKDGQPALQVKAGGSGGNIFWGPMYNVKPNTTYSCSIMFKGDVWPSTSLRFSMSFFNGGSSLGNTKTASTWTYPKHKKGQWQEAVNVFTTPGNANKARFLMSRFEDSNDGHPTFMDLKSMYCHEGNHWKGEPDPKRPFNGTLVQVTSTGEFLIDGKPQFLRCMYADNNDPNKLGNWKRYAALGWNCNMWAPNLKNIKIGVETGLTYSFMSIAPYFHLKSNPPQKGWAYGQLNLLEKNLKEILASPQAKYLVGYYFDDEALSQYDLIEKVVKIIDRLDRDKDGKRQRPMYFLEGNPGTALQHMHHMDMVGTYAGGGNTGGEGAGAASHQILNYADGMNVPVVVAQFNGGVSWGHLQKSLFHGVSMIGKWRDTKGDLLNQGWMRQFPTVVNNMKSALKTRFQNLGSLDVEDLPIVDIPDEEDDPVVEDPTPEDPPVEDPVVIEPNTCELPKQYLAVLEKMMKIRQLENEILDLLKQ